MSKKFKYTGETGYFDFDLIQAGIMPMDERLTNGQEIIVEDDARLAEGSLAVDRLRQNGLWEEVKAGRGRPRTPAEKQEDKSEGSE